MNRSLISLAAEELLKIMNIENKYQQAENMQAIGLTKLPAMSTVSETIQMLEVAVPRPEINEVAIKLVASSMHIDEIYAAQGSALGKFFAPKKPSVQNPYILGSSVSGVIVDLGDCVDEFTIGDEVIVIPNETGETSSWAEYRCISRDWIMHKPEQLNHVEAAAATMASCVAWAAVKKAKVQAGTRCVVVGASGTVGNLTLQFLKSLGCHVSAVCSANNEELVRARGADEMIDYHQHDFGPYLRFKGELQDAVFDFIGGKDIEDNARMVLKQHGNFITVVGPQKYIGEKKLSPWQFIKMLSYIIRRIVVSKFYGPGYIFSATMPRKIIHEALARLISNDIQIPIDEVIPFELGSVRGSIKRLLTHRAKGRIVIDFTKID